MKRLLLVDRSRLAAAFSAHQVLAMEMAKLRRVRMRAIVIGRIARPYKVEFAAPRGSPMRSSLPLSLLLSALALAGPARAEQLTLLDEAHLATGESSGLSAPVIDDTTGTAYWKKYIDFELGGSQLKSSSGGVIATDARTTSMVGDFPLNVFPTDAHAGSVLLLGHYLEPANPGYYQTNAIYAYPGLARLAYFGSSFPGFTSDAVGLQVLAWPLYDGTGGAVFPMRRATTFPNFRYAICRTTNGASIEILASTDTTVVPGGDGGLFTLMDRPIPSGGRILFYGEGGGRRGVYQLEGGTVTTIVDNQTVLPPNVGPVPIFNGQGVVYAIDGNDVAIVLTDFGGGVWKRVGGVWSRLIARNDPIPGGTGLLFDLGRVAIRDGIVAFQGGRNNQFAPPLQSGLYTDKFGAVTPIVNLETSYGADVPTTYEVREGGRWFDGSDVVFAVDGQQWRALYRATLVPEPTHALASAAAIATLAAIRRRRGHVS